MGKASIVCAHCEKQKLEVEFDDKQRRIKKVKGADYWFPVLTKVNDSHWTAFETPGHGHGVNVKCKCGQYSLLFDFLDDPKAITVKHELPEDQIASWFCNSCRAAFAGQKLECPNCGAAE